MKRSIYALLSLILIFTFSSCTSKPQTEDLINTEAESIISVETDSEEQLYDTAESTDNVTAKEDIIIKAEAEQNFEIIEEPIEETTSTIEETLTDNASEKIQPETEPVTEVSDVTSDVISEEQQLSDIGVQNKVASVAVTETELKNAEVATHENCDYVLNTNSKKFHYPGCSSVDTMAPHNTKYFIGTRDEAVGIGFKPCGRCKP